MKKITNYTEAEALELIEKDEKLQKLYEEMLVEYNKDPESANIEYCFEHGEITTNIDDEDKTICITIFDGPIECFTCYYFTADTIAQALAYIVDIEAAEGHILPPEGFEYDSEVIQETE